MKLVMSQRSGVVKIRMINKMRYTIRLLRLQYALKTDQVNQIRDSEPGSRSLDDFQFVLDSPSETILPLLLALEKKKNIGSKIALCQT